MGKVLDAANGAAQKMTTHAEADAEVAGLKERYNKVKAVSDEWVKKVDVLLKEWTLLDNTVTELNSWVAKDKSSEGENQFSLEKMESTLGELKNIFKEKEKLVGVCNLRPSKIQLNQIGIQSNRSECCLRPNNLNLSTIPLVPLNIYVAQFA